ncbi:MAG: hypothetical protein KKB31_07375 [Nanoarchaeota archaeon]|nr:hypothetical protein [Nanoarchaeota archaeon]
MADSNKIYLGIPTRGNLNQGLVELTWDIVREYPDLEMVIESGQHGPDIVRNAIVHNFLKTDKEWLWMIDDDGIPQDIPLRLADSGYDICGALCFGTYMPNRVPAPCIFNYNSTEGIFKIVNPTSMRGLLAVDAIGTGCIMIHRRVFEHPEFKIPFYPELNEYGARKYGGDLTFCIRAKAVGFTVAVDLDVQCNHLCRASTLQIKYAYEQATLEVLKERDELWQEKEKEWGKELLKTQELLEQSKSRSLLTNHRSPLVSPRLRLKMTPNSHSKVERQTESIPVSM